MWTAASDIAQSTNNVFLIFLGISLLLLISITITMVYFVIRFHHKNHKKAQQIKGNMKLEIIWTVIPSFMVIVMFFLGYGNFRKIREVPEDAMVVKVIGQQWIWIFEYPEWDITSENLYVPNNKPVKLEITAKIDDVVHSLFIPDFRIKEDAVPGLNTYMWFTPKRIAHHNIFCAEYCGKDHAKMITELVVVSQEDFETWIKDKIAEKNKPVVMVQALDPDSDEIERRNGSRLYGTFCASCHGEGGRGDNISGARDFTTLKNWKFGTKPTDIFRTMSNGINGTQMRSFNHLTPWNRFAIIHKVTSFYKGTDRPTDTKNDIDSLVRDFSLDKIFEVKPRISIEKAMKIMVDENK